MSHSDEERERKALELWRQWFEYRGNPYEQIGYLDDDYCFFCGNESDDGHEKDCPYVGACELLGIECK